MTTKYPFEIHLTVKNVDRKEFQQCCQALDVKPVLLDLQSRTFGVLRDAMTSSFIVDTFEQAAKEALRLSIEMMTKFNLDVTRYKIETVPWNPMALSQMRGSWQYFETHIQVYIPIEAPSSRWDELKELCGHLDLHLSKNVYKREVPHRVFMATLRDYTATAQEFTDKTSAVVAALRAGEFLVGKHDIEFAVIDSDPQHDSNWMK